MRGRKLFFETQNAQAFAESPGRPRLSVAEEVLILLVQLNLGSATSASGVTVASASPTLQFQVYDRSQSLGDPAAMSTADVSGERGLSHGSCGPCTQVLRRVNKRRTESWDLAGPTKQPPASWVADEYQAPSSAIGRGP